MSGIIRIQKNKNYFHASNIPFNDERLSWEARGVLGYLLSKPDDWECRNSDLISKGPAGEHKIKRVLAELKMFGYMTRKRLKDDEGKFYWLTTVYEDPETIGRLSIDGLSIDGSSTDGKPHHIDRTEPPITESLNTKSLITPEKNSEISELDNHFGPKDTPEKSAVQSSLNKDNFTPQAELELLTKFGHTNAANPQVEEAERRLLDSGWDIHNTDIRKACVLLIANTPMSLPTTDKSRKRWSTALKEHLKFGLDQLPDLYQRSYAKLYEREFFPGNPDGLTATMTGLYDAQRYQPTTAEFGDNSW